MQHVCIASAAASVVQTELIRIHAAGKTLSLTQPAGPVLRPRHRAVRRSSPGTRIRSSAMEFMADKSALMCFNVMDNCNCAHLRWYACALSTGGAYVSVCKLRRSLAHAQVICCSCMSCVCILLCRRISISRVWAGTAMGWGGFFGILLYKYTHFEYTQRTLKFNEQQRVCQALVPVTTTLTALPVAISNKLIS